MSAEDVRMIVLLLGVSLVFVGGYIIGWRGGKR